MLSINHVLKNKNKQKRKKKGKQNPASFKTVYGVSAVRSLISLAL